MSNLLRIFLANRCTLPPACRNPGSSAATLKDHPQ
jgi:hypothetical protein